MQIKIKNQIFPLDEISRIYPAAMVKTGEGDEVTQISLEWTETLKTDEVEIVNFAIFVHKKDKSVFPFFYETKNELLTEFARIASHMS